MVERKLEKQEVKKNDRLVFNPYNFRTKNVTKTCRYYPIKRCRY